jgi:hypothetical protein
MKSKVILSFFLLFVSLSSFAQMGLNFQGVARNSSNAILANQQVNLRLSILQGSSTGTVEYTETRKVTTNAQGLFNVVIGDANASSSIGDFSAIGWKNNPKYLKIEMDPAGGTSFILLGTTQFQYVAYAHFANSVDAANITGIVPLEKGGTGVSSLNALKTSLAIDNSLATKVDKITGKGLSSNDYTTAEKTKLEGITGKNTGDQDLSGYATTSALALKINKTKVDSSLVLKATISKVDSGLALKVDKITGKGLSSNDYTTAEKTKLAGITGTNTGDQDLSGYATTTALALKINKTKVDSSLVLKATISKVDSGLALKVDKITGKGLSSNDYTTAEKTKLEGITGTNTGDQDLSGLATNTALGLKANALDVSAGLALKENVSNKSIATDLGGLSPSDELYPSQKAVKAYITANSSSGGIADGGISTIKLADLAVTDAKLATGISKAKVGLGDVENTALSTWNGSNNLTTVGTITSGTWSGTGISIAKGGTGLNSAGSSGQILTSTGSGTFTHTFLSSIAVPYTGAIGPVDLGNYDLKVNGLSFGLGGGFKESNLSIGKNALIDNTNGIDNIGLGKNVLNKNTSGSTNIAIGNNALNFNEIGNGNIAIGFQALQSTTDESDNIALGNNSSIDFGVENAIVIGNDAIVEESNSMKIGNDQTFEKIKTNGMIHSGGINPSVSINSPYFLNHGTREGDLFYLDQNFINLYEYYEFTPGYYYVNEEFDLVPLLNNNTNNSSQYFSGPGISIDNNNTISTIQDISITSSPTLRSLSLTNGDDPQFGSNFNQIIFGWNANPFGLNNDGTIEYAHAIKTRHNSARSLGNNIDFFTWDPGNEYSSSAIGNKHIMTIQGDGKVGIGIQVPLKSLDVAGDIQTTGNLIAGEVVYPNTVGSDQNNQVLTSFANGTIGWSDFTQSQNNTNLGSAAYSQTSDFELPITFNAPFSRIGNTINIPQSTSSTSGYLSFTDWNTFNDKQNTLRQNIDYLSPSGSASLLTDFPIFNQNTTGNAQTASKLLTSREINGVAFDGSGDITITADAGTLNGTILNPTITGSSLTSVGTLVAGSVPYSLLTGTVPTWNQNTTGNAATAITAGNITATSNTTLTTLSNLTSVGTIASLSTGAIINSGKVIIGASSAASPSAALEVTSTTQGFLPPRMNAGQRNAISNPVTGLIIFCSNCSNKGQMQYFNGTAWVDMVGNAPAGVYTPIIGEAYQGGKVAYVLVSGDPGYDPTTPHGLIAATSDQSTGIQWCNNCGIPTYINGPSIGATGAAIGTGVEQSSTLA